MGDGQRADGWCVGRNHRRGTRSRASSPGPGQRRSTSRRSGAGSRERVAQRIGVTRKEPDRRPLGARSPVRSPRGRRRSSARAPQSPASTTASTDVVQLLLDRPAVGHRLLRVRAAAGCWTAAARRARAAARARPVVRDAHADGALLRVRQPPRHLRVAGRMKVYGPGVAAFTARNAALSSCTSWPSCAKSAQTSVKWCRSSSPRMRRIRSSARRVVRAGSRGRSRSPVG